MVYILAVVVALVGAILTMAVIDLFRSKEPRSISVTIIVWANWFFAALVAVLFGIFFGKWGTGTIGVGIFLVVWFALCGFFVKKKYQKHTTPSSKEEPPTQ